MSAAFALDAGTSTTFAIRPGPDGSARILRQRTAFLDFADREPTRAVLRRLGVRAEAREGRLFVAGDAAYLLARVFEKDVRRPLRDGALASDESAARAVLESLVRALLGPAPRPNTPCAFTVPGPDPKRDRDMLFLQGAFERILAGLGYAPLPVREGLAVVLAELAASDCTGLAISFGGGMTHFCAAYRGVDALAFSIPRGGDWIDRRAAQALGYLPPEVCAVKESGMDLRSPHGRIEEAIAIYARHLVRWVTEEIHAALSRSGGAPQFHAPVPFVLAGGLCLLKGFVEMFTDEWERAGVPIAIERTFRAAEPLTSAVRGASCAAAILQTA